MWKKVNYSNFTPSKCYATIRSDFINEILCYIKIKPINFSTIRHQTTKSSKYESHTLAKSPPPHYIKYKQDHQKGNQKITVGEFLLLTVPISTFALGTWQVKRREWKLKLIEDLEKKLSEPPISLPKDLSELPSLEYRKIKVKGKFDHEHELFLGPRSLISKGKSSNAGGGIISGRQTAGHLVITPFILSDSGQQILINRGWVPTSSLKASKRPEGQIEDEVEVVGVVRLHEERGVFMASNMPHLGVYHYRDLKKMAMKTNSLPVFLDACEESTVDGGPIGGQTNVSIRNEHMSYIITWYSLSVLTAILWCKKFLFK